MTFEDKIKQALGEQLYTICFLKQQLEEAQKRIASLEADRHEPITE